MERSWVARLAEDLGATRAELAGLALLLAGGVLVTVIVVGRVPTGSVDGPGPAAVAPTTDVGEAPAPATAPGVTPSPGVTAAASPTAGPTGTPPPGPALVHVTGAVASPGVVEVPSGARLVEAVAAAGGARRNAATDALNLAQPVVDGQRLHVPTRSEAAAAREATTAAALDPATGLPSAGTDVSGMPSSGPSAPAGGTPTASTPSLVDLNTATPPALEELPGIGPVLAERIVAWREEHGGFRDPGQLREVSGIGDATFQDLAPLVTVS